MNYLLLENGDKLILEDSSGFLLLESVASVVNMVVHLKTQGIA
jgi:hypothetical protein